MVLILNLPLSTAFASCYFLPYTVNRGPLSPITIEHSWTTSGTSCARRDKFVLRNGRRFLLACSYSIYFVRPGSVPVLTRRLYSGDPCIPNLPPLAISFHYITCNILYYILDFRIGTAESSRSPLGTVEEYR